MNFKNIMKKIKKINFNKNTSNMIILFLLGILLIIGSNLLKPSPKKDISRLAFNSKDKNEKSEDNEYEKTIKSEGDYENTVKNELKNILSKIQGVGIVEVMIYFESGEEQVPAMNINDSINSTEENDNEGGKRNTTQKNNGSTVVITNSGSDSKPLIVKKIKPKVTGVVVVAEGAEEKVTELRITKAVVDLFNVPEEKVNVYPMKK
ncbi:hypothetical protein CLOACE_01970 [Clostridium acetireducens DSM 10703]|uniref:Stage III sporulation protein AG n=1 Tax=Clostridium acetireducens DSM 10703 TaxID=1121290 RepID=A0A1E8F1S4_9CLOT|nr:stage III sporulation protein AG [Clostridium acetireducens]OFI07593.1 hypothetical protein CLOACE_01970 [Clostridium acetireducens DSM 10703]